MALSRLGTLPYVFRTTTMALSRLGTLPYVFRTTIRMLYSGAYNDGNEDMLLLRDIDLLHKDPRFFRTITKDSFFERFSVKLIRINQVGSDQVRRLGIVLPLLTGYKDDVIPIPFVLDTGAPDYVYLCKTAMKKLSDLDSIEGITGLYSYRLIGRLLGAGERYIENPFVSLLPYQFERYEPDDSRLNLLGLNGAIELGMNNLSW